jgi:hypothetical protein
MVQRAVSHTIKAGPSPKSASRGGFRAELKADKIKPEAMERDEADVTRLLHAQAEARAPRAPRITIGSSAFFTLLLGVVVIGGIAAIIWLREFAETLGVKWN